ncbi:MAG: molecular chaperone SurA [Gammaproteobacteria bacterium]|nr:molecular chaperone SurA [Gammaproteobacteria bacterium]
MKHNILNRLIMTLGLLLGLTHQAFASTDIDRIVAIVNDDVVVQSELDTAIQKIVLQLQQQGTRLPPRQTLESQVLERVILNKLQIERAAQVGINVSEDVLAQAVGNIARKAGMTLSQLRDALEQSGLSFRAYRESIRNQIIAQQLVDQEIRRRIRVSDQEVESFITKQPALADRGKSYHLLHILIATHEEASPEALQQAKEKAGSLVTQLRSGADFNAIAVAESDGSQALEGGDLGWRKSDQLPTLFTEVVTDMQVGDVSDPIHARNGYNIIKVADIKGGEKSVITQTQVRHILVHINEITSDDEARIRLEQLKTRLEGGENFASLARSHSDDKGSAIKGGELGWVTPGDLLPTFEEQMEKLAPNELSHPFRTEFGWHLIEVTARRDHDNTADIQKAEARQVIKKRKMIVDTELYMRRLRDEAYVEIRLDSQ